jgi:hypothetical protein
MSDDAYLEAGTVARFVGLTQNQRRSSSRPMPAAPAIADTTYIVTMTKPMTISLSDLVMPRLPFAGLFDRGTLGAAARLEVAHWIRNTG